MEAVPRSSASFPLSLVSSLIGHSEILASPRHNDCLPAPLRRDTKSPSLLYSCSGSRRCPSPTSPLDWSKESGKKTLLPDGIGRLIGEKGEPVGALRRNLGMGQGRMRYCTFRGLGEEVTVKEATAGLYSDDLRACCFIAPEI